jgi:hypothetical protein
MTAIHVHLSNIGSPLLGSGKVSFGNLFPEVVTLGIGIGHVRLAHPQHFFQHGPIRKRRPAQRSPIPPLAAGDDVVNGGQGELLMSEVSV